MAKSKSQTASKLVRQSYEMVAVDNLKPHPRNARKSDNAAIDRSIESNGFFGAILVQRSTGFILAGAHRWDRAKNAGIAEVPVLYAEVDDKAALRILSADNRVSDSAGYDQEALAKLLCSIQSECGSLEGSGYVPEDYSRIVEQVGDQIKQQAKQRIRELSPPAPEEPEAEPEEAPEAPQYVIVVRCQDQANQAEVLQKLIALGLACEPATGDQVA